tara:strand:- start:1107 stop:2231 length:1125 start_codon:yes stop_codon:yes gene_type:complete
MSEEFKVKAVEFEEKSTQEIENELLKNAENANNNANGAGMEGSPEGASASQEQETIQPQGEAQESSLKDEDVLSYIGKRYDREINSLDELFEQRNANEDLPEDVSAFLKYKKETGRDINDFVKINKNYDDVGDDQLLLDYYLEQNKGLDPEDISFEIEDKFSYDEDLDEEREIKSKKLAKKKELVKAREHFNSLKEQYKVPLESRDSFVPEEERESFNSYKETKEQRLQNEQEITKRAEHFSSKTSDLFSENFEGFGFNVSDDKKIVYKPSDSKTLLNEQSDLNNFVNKFTGKDGSIEDFEGFHRSIAVASNPEKFAKYFYDQGTADAVGNVAKESKNIDMTRSSTKVTPKEGFQVRNIDADRGNRLIIKKTKN